MRITARCFFRVCTFSLAIVIVLYLTGAYLYLLERDYYTEFSYPLDKDLTRYIFEWRAGRELDLQTVNRFHPNLRIDSSHKCRNQLSSFEPIRILFVVKSAVENFDNRRVIRSTWGWENRFSDVSIRCVFLLGLPKTRNGDDVFIQSKIDFEQQKNMDLVQAEFVDNYFNNTMKAILGLKWIKEYCPKAKHILFVDDDYYVSAKNILRFLRRPADYPEYLKRALLAFDTSDKDKQLVAPKDSEENDLINDSVGEMYVGYRFFSKPHRIRFQKWFISLEEYPYNKFPPYVTAGAYLISQQTAETFYFASLYTVPFRFDDVYLGILAKKMQIEPIHSEHFYFYKPKYSAADFAYVIASHGFKNSQELVSVWNEQRSLGNA